MRLKPGPSAIHCLILCLLAELTTFGLTLDQIRHTPNLTPQKFASFFNDFDFKFRAQVQQPEVFLATESGDCDDFAILAATVLKEKGYTPRLIAVRMPKIVHVVCYVEETRSYLDYNNRAYLKRTIRSSGEIHDIAAKVAKSYNAKWASASEFTFEDGVKRLVATVVEGKQPPLSGEKVASLTR
jgi:hypothetical protein